jgi:ubiquinone/menaquinone biosynthesis C-methylase UbiE
MAANKSKPLLDSEATPDSRKGECRCLGETETFEIDPLRNKLPPTSLSAIKYTLALFLSPLLVSGMMLFSTVMFIGPRWLKNKILSIMIPRIMKRQAERFLPERNELLAGIQPGDVVLDVGCGGGAYLRHYTKASRIVALEPVQAMHHTISKTAEQVGIERQRLTILPFCIEEYIEQHKSVQFDWIILGNVLCEVENQISTLQCVDRLCKSKGGHVYVSEHVGSPLGTCSRRFQSMINPWWKTISGGCNCNRDTLESIQAVFDTRTWDLAVWHYPHVNVALGPSFLAMARKK